jgi:hypothetical protein
MCRGYCEWSVRIENDASLDAVPVACPLEREPTEYERLLATSEGKIKIKLSLCLTKDHVMKAYGGVEV